MTDDKTLMNRIYDQLTAANKLGLKACAFTVEDTQHIADLIDAGWRMRNTAIVDDDFPEMREAFDRLLLRAMGE